MNATEKKLRARTTIFAQMAAVRELLDEIDYFEASVSMWHCEKGPRVVVFQSTPEMRKRLVEKYGRPALGSFSSDRGPRAKAEFSTKEIEVSVMDWPAVVTVTEESVSL